MADSLAGGLAGVVLAAGAGRRLAPLTLDMPKAMCPVAEVSLVDHALARLAPVCRSRAVNVHHYRERMAEHLSSSEVHVSIEPNAALGTAGALGHLREWIDGRPVLITNCDAWLPVEEPDRLDDWRRFVSEWDGEQTRLLVVGESSRGDFGTARYCGAALMPWADIAGLEAVESGLYEARWRRSWEQGRLDLVSYSGPFIDCGTPGDYLAANLAANGNRSVIATEAKVDADALVSQSVLWPGAEVLAGETLDRAIRTRKRTVLVR